jgi:hypothetical protein
MPATGTQAAEGTRPGGTRAAENTRAGEGTRAAENTRAGEGTRAAENTRAGEGTRAGRLPRDGDSRGGAPLVIYVGRGHDGRSGAGGGRGGGGQDATSSGGGQDATSSGGGQDAIGSDGGGQDATGSGSRGQDATGSHGGRHAFGSSGGNAIASNDDRNVTGSDAPGGRAERIDVRLTPLAVRDGCAPDRIPAGRWPSDEALVRSEQFAVNEALGPRDDRPAGPGNLLAVHAPPGTGVAAVFGDLVAAIVTERARRIADLPDPGAAFGAPRAWGSHAVAAPAAALTGFEIVLAAPDTSAPTGYGLPPIGTRWRDPVARTDYFASTARLADGVGAWAMLTARLGDGPANRAFAERWWRGLVRGTDVLFPAGESMAAGLRRLTAEGAAVEGAAAEGTAAEGTAAEGTAAEGTAAEGAAVDWTAAVANFRLAVAAAESLAAERMRVAAALARLSVLEQACEEASGAAETGQAALADLTAREPAIQAAVLAADNDHRTRLAALGAHELSRPALTTVTEPGRAALRTSAALSTAVAGGLRRGRNWRNWTVTRRQLRTACAEATRRRDATAAEAEALRAGLAAARAAVDEATAEVARLAAELGPLAETVAEARQRWGDHVPDGPAQAETEDAALIEWRETCAPWADEEYAAARAEVFLAALELHKALIAARADVFAGNLGALMDLLGGGGQAPSAAAAADGEVQPEADAAGTAADPAAAGDTPAAADGPGALLAAWQTFFLVVPVVHVPFEAAETLFAGLGEGSLGWLLAGGAERLLPGEAQGLLSLVDHAILAGDAVGAGAGDSVQRVTDRTARFGTWLPADPAGLGGSAGGCAEGRIWVGLPLRVVRGIDRAVIDLRNEQAYDGLLISDRD